MPDVVSPDEIQGRADFPTAAPTPPPLLARPPDVIPAAPTPPPFLARPPDPDIVTPDQIAASNVASPNDIAFGPEETAAHQSSQALAMARDGQVDMSPDQMKQHELAVINATGAHPLQRLWHELPQIPQAYFDSADAAHNYLFHTLPQQYEDVKTRFSTQPWRQTLADINREAGEIGDRLTIKPQDVPVAITTGGAKVLGFVGDVGSVLYNTVQMPPGFGGEEVTPEAEKQYKESQAEANAYTDYLNTKVSRANDWLEKTTGANTKNPLYGAIQMIPFWAVPVSPEILGPARIDAALSRMAQTGINGAKLLLESQGPYVAGTAISETASHLGAHLLGVSGAEPITIAMGALGIPSISRITKAGLDATIEKINKMSMDELLSNTRLAMESPNGSAYIDALNKRYTERINTLGDRIKVWTSRLSEDQKSDLLLRNQEGNYVFDGEDLSGPAKKVRAAQAEVDRLAAQKDGIFNQSFAHQALNQSTRYFANAAIQTGLSTGIGGAFGGIGAPTGQTGYGIAAGSQLGLELGGPLSLYGAYAGMHANRIGYGNHMWFAMGDKNWNPDWGPTASPGARNWTTMLNGIARGLGREIHVLRGQDFADAEANYSGRPIPEGAPAEEVAALPPNGFVGSDGNLYINGDRVPTGVAGHEVAHLTQFMGQLVRESSPELMSKFEEAYNAALGIKPGEPGYVTGQQLLREKDAEVGRIVLQQIPLGLLWGGATPADKVARVARGLVNFFLPDKAKVDPQLQAPFNRADIARMKQRLFEVGALGRPEAFERFGPEPPAGAVPVGVGAPPTPPTVLSPAEHEILQRVHAASRTLGGIGVSAGDIGDAIVAAKQAGVEVNDSNILRMALNQANGRDLFHGIAVPVKPPIVPETPLPVPEKPVGVTEKPPTVTHPDYGAIRTQAEEAMRQKLAGSKAKTKEADIANAGIVAAAQAHAQAVGPDSDLITWRTDKYGKTWIGGQRADPNDPFHRMLLDRANLPPEAIRNLNDLEANMGRAIAVDYSHAPEEGEAVTKEERAAARAAATAPERVTGEVAREKLTKSYVPTAVTYYPKANAFVVNGFSTDKFLNNANIVINWAYGKGMQTYNGVNDPLLVEHVQGLTDNHQNGFTGNGKPIKGTALTPVEQTPGYTPYVIPKPYLDQLNVMMGNDTAKTGVKGLSPEQAEKQALAKQNSPYFDPATGEVNKLRGQMGDDAKKLESPYETLRPELIDRVRQAPVQDIETLRPTGFIGDRAQLALRGLPRQEFTAAGFMPATGGGEPEPLSSEQRSRMIGMIQGMAIQPRRAVPALSNLSNADVMSITERLSTGSIKKILDTQGIFTTDPREMKSQLRNLVNRYKAGTQPQYMPPTGFYTKSGRTIDEKMPNAADSEQVKALLRNAGVGKNEMEWLGLNDLPAGKMTKGEVQDWITAHTPEISVTQLGGRPPPPAISSLLRWYLEQSGTPIPTNPNEWYGLSRSLSLRGTYSVSFNDMAREALKISRDVEPARVKYPQYSLPGGENYREILVNLPQVHPDPTELDAARDRLDQVRADFRVADRANNAAAETYQLLYRQGKLDEAAAAAARHQETYRRLENLRTMRTMAERNVQLAESGTAKFTSPHFGDYGENLLGHLRVDDRTTASGNKMRFAEELQSDWAQSARAQGVKRPVDPKSLDLAEGDYVWSFTDPKSGNAFQVAKPGYGRGVGVIRPEAPNEIFARQVAAGYLGQEGIADFPFKGEAWKKLLLRQLIKTGVEEGKDSVGWTTGAQQAQRYDLEKHISAVTAQKFTGGYPGPAKYDVGALDKQGNRILSRRVEESELPQFVGKDLANKIIADTEDGRWHHYSGLDLKVGGEGMKGFYDRELVNIANDIGKKFGAKVQDAQIGVGGLPIMKKGVPVQPQETVHELPITPQMRESVLEQGQPMFMPSTAPDGIREAAIEYEGRIFTGPWHTAAVDAAASQLGLSREQIEQRANFGFVTNSNDFVDRRKALDLALKNKQLTPVQSERMLAQQRRAYGGRESGLEAVTFAKAEKPPEPMLMPATELSPAAQEAFDAAKSTPDEFGIVDVSHLTPADRRALAVRGLSIRTTRDPNQLVASYPRELRARDLREAVLAKRAGRGERPQLMPATGGEARAHMFYSPNETDLNFDQALVALRSPKQTYAQDVGKVIDDALGLNAVYHDAIGDTKTYGAENSVVSEMSNIQDFDELRYAAALRGRDLNQKSVLAFLEQEDGDHALFSLTVPERDFPKLRTQLDDAGLEFRTLLPQADGTRIQIFSKDPDADLSALHKFTDVYNERGHDIDIQGIRGTGEFVGEADTREEAQGNYAKIIQDYEGRYPDRLRGPAQRAWGDYTGRAQPALMPATLLPEQQKAWSEIARYLTPEQLGRVAERFRDRIIEPYLQLDSDFGRSLLYAQKGAVGRKWYADFVNSISDIFGSDHPEYARDPQRFAALMAALSANRSVPENVEHSLMAWALWEAQGRPQDRAAIEDIIHATVPSEAGTEEVKQSLPAWIPNAFRAFTAEDPTAVRLSGPKVHAFYRNLIGDVHAVTVDRHMGIFGYGTPTVGARRVAIGKEKFGIESFKNLALQAHVRKLADVMSRISGETWTPAEVQASIWTYQLPVQDLADKLGVTVKEFLAGGREVPKELMEATPSSKLLQSEKSQATIRRLQGLREKNIRAAREAGAGVGGEGEEVSGETGGAESRRGETPFAGGGVVKSGGVYLVRHGCTRLNEQSSKQSPDVIRGHVDVPLDAKGHKQAEKLGKDLADKSIAVVFSSDLSRSMHTAAPIAQSNNAPLMAYFGLRPWNLGHMQGKPAKDVQPQIDHLIDHPDVRAEGGESCNEFMHRFLSTVRLLVRANEGNRIAIVTHYRGSKLLGALDKNGAVNNDEFKRKGGALEPGDYQFLETAAGNEPMKGIKQNALRSGNT